MFAHNAYATGVSFDIESTDAMYSVNSSDPFTDLLAAHDAATNQYSSTTQSCIATTACSCRAHQACLLPALALQVGADWGAAATRRRSRYVLLRLGVENSCTGTSSISFSFNGGA